MTYKFYQYQYFVLIKFLKNNTFKYNNSFNYNDSFVFYDKYSKIIEKPKLEKYDEIILNKRCAGTITMFNPLDIDYGRT